MKRTTMTACVLGLLAGVACALAGCGASIQQEGGQAEVHRRVVTTVDPDGTVHRTENVGGSSKGISGSATGDKASLSGDGAPAPFIVPEAPAPGNKPGGVQPSAAPFEGWGKGSDWGQIILRVLIGLLGIGLGYRAYLAATTAQPRQAALSAVGGVGCLAAAMFPAIMAFVVVAVLTGGVGYLLWEHFDQKKVRAMRGNAFDAVRSAASAALASGPAAWDTWWANFVKFAEPAEVATMRKAVQTDNPTAPPPMPDVPVARA